MKKLFFIPLIALCTFAVMSFNSVSEKTVIGMYGVSDTDPAKIQLIIGADHTFTYQDYSDMSKIIMVTGRWEQKEEFVVLKDYVSTYKFHDVWKISADGKVARSKMGITIYTLTKQSC